MFITIKDNAVAEIIEKKSRFIGQAFIIQNEEQAEDYILKVRKEHYKATHNCYAYQLDENIQKFSDDGEPSGTAGRPIFDVIKGKEIKNALVVVTRYFGGTLLGTGGLVRAYSRATKEVIEQAELIRMVTIKLIKLVCSYNEFGKLEYLLKSNNYIIRETLFTNEVNVFVEVTVENVEHFKKFLIDKTNNSIKIIEKNIELIAQNI
ncbi:YigZ family protein [Candidatus Epulonipiscioides gigas]|nr:YigZ family protein [Epulopiscium sp. SCG-C07WGA-EpuloA2]